MAFNFPNSLFFSTEPDIDIYLFILIKSLKKVKKCKRRFIAIDTLGKWPEMSWAVSLYHAFY